jgi:hypothetical protein
MDIVKAYCDDNIFFEEELEPQTIPVEVHTQGNFEVDKKLVEFTPMMRDSDLQKSLFHGKLPDEYRIPEMIPSILRPFTRDGEEIDPLMLSLKNYNFPMASIPCDLIEKAVWSYEQVMLANPYDSVKKPALDIVEILHGFNNLKGISPTTSPGMPYKLTGHENLKEKYFKNVEIYGLDSDEASEIRQRIADEVAVLEELLMKGIRPIFIYTDNLKSEKRKREKVLKGLTRLFAGSPFQLLLLFRKYFGAIMDYFIGGNIDLGIGVGLNPYSMQWDAMARQLNVFDDFGACDYSKFDGHQHAGILWAIGVMFVRWYGDDGFMYLRMQIWTEITSSRHSVAGFLIEWYCNLPSGNPLTAIINCVYNQLNFRMCWVLKGLDIVEFNTHVVLKTMGDDGAFSISSKYIHDFNEITLPGLMSKIGMVYTSETKSDEASEVKSRKITDIVFLKRSFVFDKRLNRWIAPINFRDNIETLNWTKKKFSDRIAVDNVGSVLREISLHGKEEYEKWYGVLTNLLQENYPGHTPSYPISGDWRLMYHKTLDYEYTY